MTQRDRMVARLAAQIASGLVVRQGEDGLPEFDVTGAISRGDDGDIDRLAGTAVHIAESILSQFDSREPEMFVLTPDAERERES